MKSIIKCDESLIREAQLKATGMTIHWLIGKIATYKCWIDLYSRHPEKSEWLEKIKESEQKLRLFIAGNPECGCPALRK